MPRHVPLIKQSRRIVVAVSLLIAADGSQAFEIHVPVYTGVPLMVAAGVVNQQTLDLALSTRTSRDDEDLQEEESAEPTRARTIVSGTSGGYVGRLVQAYPEADRVEARRVFEELLAGYRGIEDRFGIPRNDLAGSVAAFLAGSYMAYRNVDFPDAHFEPLVEQMRQVISRDERFLSAKTPEKLESFEQTAILGMYMATTQMALKQQPDPTVQSRLREAARGYLQEFLEVDADRVQITSAGLQLR